MTTLAFVSAGIIEIFRSGQCRQGHKAVSRKGQRGLLTLQLAAMTKYFGLTFCAALLLVSVGSGIGGSMMGAGALQPQRRPFTVELRQQAEGVLRASGTTWEDFSVHAQDE